MISGGVIDILVSPRTHRSVEIEAIMFYSTRSIIPYPFDKRDCVFEDEMTWLRPFYTYSDCIVDCRIEDVWKICKCVPFYLPNRSKFLFVSIVEDRCRLRKTKLHNKADVRDTVFAFYFRFRARRRNDLHRIAEDINDSPGILSRD